MKAASPSRARPHVGMREGLTPVEFITLSLTMTPHNEDLWLTPWEGFLSLKNDLSYKQTKPI